MPGGYSNLTRDQLKKVLEHRKLYRGASKLPKHELIRRLEEDDGPTDSGDGTDLLSQLYEVFTNVHEDAVAYVGDFKTQTDLYTALFHMDKLVSGKPPRYLEPSLSGAAATLYGAIRRFDLNLTSPWPAGDYNTVRDALNDLPQWPALAKWTLAGYVGPEDDAATAIEVRTMTIWHAFGVPYLVALWNLKHPARGNKLPPSVFAFVYDGGGAGVFVASGGTQIEAKALTAFHCVSYEEGIRESPAIVMNTSGQVGIFKPERTNRKYDYAVGSIRGMTMEPATTEGDITTNTTVAAYGCPSTRSDYGTQLPITWPWLDAKASIVNEFFELRKKANSSRKKKSRKSEPVLMQEASEDYAELVEDHALYMYDNNFFYKQTGVIKRNKTQVKTVKPNSPDFHHTATAAAGMSGGPIFSKKNVLIGIHTGWDDEAGYGLGLLARFALGISYRDRVTLGP